ncbi:NepR family anti-sigma factor [Erythrobacter sp. JK5]|uniref:NepR family anti-sigma factor n=1 Tax=Erythrobacter sp. JK5 TaxID=2829500 RepID=UPI002010E2EA|nr:NepR family anti-sigma factor [Erythrobacter sp. JK5]
MPPANPDWADGLKQLYDAVVEEPLPDAFKDLLDKLDEDPPVSNGDAGTSGKGAPG